jgi:hypothetical protein
VKLVVPCLGAVDPADARLSALAEFCGITSEDIPLYASATSLPGNLETAIGSDDCCFVVNPAVIQKWTQTNFFPQDLARYLLNRFPFLLVHALDDGPFASSTLRALSDERLTDIGGVSEPASSYRVPAGAPRFTGAFSGLTFGGVDLANDRVFIASMDRAGSTPLVTIGTKPILAHVSTQRAEVLFLASRQLADLDAAQTDFNNLKSFSRLVLPIMLLRGAFERECWRPTAQHATLSIDDPLLQQRYGYLKYSKLLELMDRYNFHTSIAFIPRNRLRSTRTVIDMFLRRPDRFSCAYTAMIIPAVSSGYPTSGT